MKDCCKKVHAQQERWIRLYEQRYLELLKKQQDEERAKHGRRVR